LSLEGIQEGKKNGGIMKKERKWSKERKEEGKRNKIRRNTK
jgi:hypothetical protein